MKLTHRQYQALTLLEKYHERYPKIASFRSSHLGVNTASILRRLASHGLVHASKGGAGTRQFFSITDAGRTALRDAGDSNDSP